MTAVTRHVVGRVDDMPPGSRVRVRVNGRPIAVFNVEGSFYALKDVCPHQGAALSDGVVVSELTADRPGEYTFCSDAKRVRCPWHGWEYDLATGRSSYDPEHDRVRAFSIGVEAGSELLEDGRVAGPYVAETVTVVVEESYVIVEV
jgi:3-phenylpropionate/trans-cinnamate dioxygenase ferredoxin subunit